MGIDGNLENGAVTYEYIGVSPALNVNLSSVIFSSEISSTDKIYKLTIKDQDASGYMQMVISSEGADRGGEVCTVPYTITGAHAGNATQVSVVVTTKTWSDTAGWSDSGELLQYTKLNVDNFSVSGTGTFTLPSSLAGKTWGTDFNVYLVAEIVNSGNVTDYASAPVQLGIKNKIIDIPVNFKVIGGAWDDSGKKDDIVVHLTRREDEDKVLILRESDIPRVGNKPDDGFTAGSWDVNPTNYLDKVISKELTFTYTYDEKTRISKTVTFKVANGSWDDGTATDRTVTLNGHEGDTLKLSDGQIPAVGSKPADGFKEGSWDVTPSTETAITEDVTYTYTYSKKDAAVVTVAPKAKTGLVASGSPQELVTAGMASGGTMQYALGSDGTMAPGSGWDTTIPVGTDAGTYYVWYKAVGDKDHLDSKADCVTATIAEKPVTPVYSYTEGSGAEWTKENKTGLDFTITGSPDTEIIKKFTGLTSDGSAVAEKNYTATSGSVKLTLKAEWLETLAAGTHTLTANFTDGKAETSFTVKDASPTPTPEPTATPTATPTAIPTYTPAPTDTPAPTSAPTPTPKPKKVPKTGDGAPLALWLGLVLAGTICLGTVIAQMRRSRKKEET